MNKMRLVKLDFEDILKHDSEVLCVHTFLKDPKYHKPMLFNELLVEIGTDFGPGNCKSIFRDGEWYIKTLDSNKTLVTVIDISKYRNRSNNNDIDELNNIFDSVLEDIYSELLITDLINGIEEVDKRTEMGKKHIKSFEDIGKIITLKKPRVSNILLSSDELDRLLDEYIDTIGDVRDENNQYLGKLISYSEDKISIKMDNLYLYNSMKEHNISLILETAFGNINKIDTILSIVIHEEKKLRI